ncbi:MAG: LPS export ABC transporter ATP-binding protein [PS1 clade bacterium]|uniref:Lipopolysaccharide export system ATP-binding protein LptB n=1 Tax=PS1 clade bacterium TaxID=2175152 RepID=A0A937HI03_9PROT|nr:LPS export ABC transporter ATP-binding protein [PS1 clade bacterium]
MSSRPSDLTAPVPTLDGLQAIDLCKSYKGRHVVKNMSLQFNRREAIGLLGPNGAGKTTSFYMITGLVRPDSGRILLDGQDVSHLPMYRRARLGIGYLPQEASIFSSLSVEANIMSILQIVEPDPQAQGDKLENLLQEFSVTHVRHSAGGALSGGERRRVEIARALASDPSFILLDEPFAGIDPIAISDIRALVAQLKDRGLGVLITDHNVRETLGIIDRAVIMHDGNVLTEGTADEIVNNEAVRASYLGDDFTL